MRKLTKEEFEKYIKGDKFRPNPAFMTEEFYKANKEYFDEIGVVGVFEGEPITVEEALRGMLNRMLYPNGEVKEAFIPKEE